MQNVSPLSELGQWALFYQSIGWSVIPLRPGAKEPLIQWKQFQSKAATAAQIAEWWTGWPDANVGIVTGAVSRLAVVDIDDAAAGAWARANLPPTPVQVATRPDHAHLYFRHPGVWVPNRTRIGGHGVDLRGDGGYVVAPPSIHPSGNCYTFAGAYDHSAFQALPPLPLDLLGLPAEGESANQPDDALAWLRSQPEPVRHEAHPDDSHRLLFRYTLDLVRRFDLGRADAFVVLETWNCALPPTSQWTGVELAHKVDEALRELDRTGEKAGRIRALHERYTLIQGSATAWDQELERAVPLPAIRAEHPSAADAWIKDPAKRIVSPGDIVFAPQGAREGQINLFRGLPLAPNPEATCARIVEHVHHLCGRDPGLAHWVLSWLALPLQKLGEKLQTSLVLVGPQGAGKSLLAEIMLRIYGVPPQGYGGTIGQDELDSQFNGWASRKLFVVAEEVVSRQARHDRKNPLKALITGRWIQVNEKYQALREEENHVNIVFISNELTPLLVECDDRRHTIIRVPPPPPPEYFTALVAEIEAGGHAGFLHFLLNYDLRGFHRASPPHLTAEKAELIKASLSPDDSFLIAWWSGEFSIEPPVDADRLYQTYCARCSAYGYTASNRVRFFRVVGVSPFVRIERDRVAGRDRLLYFLRR